MKILFVAMSNSIHTARWINQIADQDWEIYLYPSDIFEIPNENIKGVKIFNSRLFNYFIKAYKRKKNNNNSIDLNLLSNQNFSFYAFLKKIFDKLFPNFYAKKLTRVIKKIKPDIIHSLHIQKGGYAVSDVKKNFSGAFPKWVVSNWGSELTLFGFIKSYDKLIKDVLKNCDYFFCECRRDIALARKLGFKGKTLPVLPNSGGIDFNYAKKFINNKPPSERKSIIVKGYQGWAGRALVGLRALERCKDLLSCFKIYIYSADTVEVKIYSELMREKEGIETIIIPLNTPREELLEYFAMSRIYIGLSI
ncbi:MAG: glycosyltransferase, partial [Candidatus Humimicrobiaceae bacterium]